jgi:hypothetical protein
MLPVGNTLILGLAMNAIDEFRMKIMAKTASVNSFSKSWSIWQPTVDAMISPQPTAEQVFNLGNYLSAIFQSNEVSGRGQSAVSTGGTAWECLVVWYLNLVFFGTNVIAARRNISHIPEGILNALSVTIANHSTNSESDIIVFSIPDAGNLKNLTLNEINELISSNQKQSELSVVQCKTNWNDNSQIPMLWDLIYNSTGQNRVANVSVGINGVSPMSFKRFSYAFMTVPTQKESKPYKPNAVAVLRVKSLTGGNYWGKATTPSIASSINEYFGRNFGEAFHGGVKSHIANQLSVDSRYYERFREINFN